jgi:hypothetical protein
MSEQIFISYRRTGGDVSAKLICEALKNHGFSVFYDFDSLHGGFFDTRIIDAIEHCTDVVLVLPPNALDRCTNHDDWVRQEITTALRHGKNIVPVMLPDFKFPKTLPREIAEISRINAVPFSMPFFDAMITTIIERLKSQPIVQNPNAMRHTANRPEYAHGLTPHEIDLLERKDEIVKKYFSLRNQKQIKKDVKRKFLPLLFLGVLMLFFFLGIGIILLITRVALINSGIKKEMAKNPIIVSEYNELQGVLIKQAQLNY